MVKVKLDLKFLYWYLSLINEYFRIHILLPLDVSFCYTFNSHEKILPYVKLSNCRPLRIPSVSTTGGQCSYVTVLTKIHSSNYQNTS